MVIGPYLHKEFIGHVLVAYAPLGCPEGPILGCSAFRESITASTLDSII